MRLKTIVFIAMCAVFAPISPRDARIDPALAKRYFQEAQWASEDDGGKLWGAKLYGPTLFFDPATGDAIANQADGEKKLTAKDGVFVAKVPKDFAGANTALDWSGVHWTVVLWPLPDASFQVHRRLGNPERRESAARRRKVRERVRSRAGVRRRREG